MTEIIGYLASVFIGLALGLIGGGGSILTVPVLVYIFSVDAVSATAYSLFIVGITSAFGSISFFRKKLVNIRTAVIFGIPSIITVYVTRAFIVPAIPNEIMELGNVVITKHLLIMLLFALLMLFSAYSMIKKENDQELNSKNKPRLSSTFILLEGLVVGFLTGLVGAGGGFLIIPALVLISKLPMKQAIATSLVVVTAKSLIGFMGESSETIIDWDLLAKVSLFAIFGIGIGIFLSSKIKGEKLKPAFGWFVMIMGVYIIAKELFLN